MALVDANYKFIYVDVGAAGRAGDAGVFNDSTLKRTLFNGSLNLPEPVIIMPNSQTKVSYHIVGDDAFPMSEHLLKPYPHKHVDTSKRVFNYRLSRARRVSENAFGILANRFRVFLGPINLGPDTVSHIILAASCLHNYMVEKNKMWYTSVCDVEDLENHQLNAGVWRNDPSFTDLAPSSDRNPSQIAKEQRFHLTNFFMSDQGKVPWQEHMI